MVLGCGNKCVKYLVFVFNFLVFVVGAVILGVSLTIRFSNEVQQYFQKILNQSESGIDIGKMYVPLYVLATVGALLLVTGFLGCCGAGCENTCLLGMFFTIVLVLFIVELACGIAILVNKSWFKEQLFEGVTKGMGNYTNWPDDVKKSVDEMQKEWECCGCESPNDYPADHRPETCKEYPNGCCIKMWDAMESKLVIVGGVALGILLIELLAMIFSCMLCQAFKRGDYQYA